MGVRYEADHATVRARYDHLLAATAGSEAKMVRDPDKDYPYYGYPGGGPYGPPGEKDPRARKYHIALLVLFLGIFGLYSAALILG